MYEWIKKYWYIPVALAVLLFVASGAGVGYFAVKKQLAEAIEHQLAVSRELQNIGTGIKNIESISGKLADGVDNLQNSTGRIEDAVGGIESANVNIEYSIGVGENLVTESECIIKRSLDILESIEAEMDKDNGNNGGE